MAKENMDQREEAQGITNALLPALTPSEWHQGGASRLMEGAISLKTSDIPGSTRTSVYVAGDVDPYTQVPDSLRHACAALCLYEQPFGFTREDVRFLKKLVNNLRCDPVMGSTTYGALCDAERALREQGRQIIAKIASLLPPE